MHEHHEQEMTPSALSYQLRDTISPYFHPSQTDLDRLLTVCRTIAAILPAHGGCEEM
jgi:hypothetical protein